MVAINLIPKGVACNQYTVRDHVSPIVILDGSCDLSHYTKRCTGGHGSGRIASMLLQDLKYDHDKRPKQQQCLIEWEKRFSSAQFCTKSDLSQPFRKVIFTTVVELLVDFFFFFCKY